MSTKGQIAYEYLLLMSFLTLIFTVWLLIAAEGHDELKWEHDEYAIEDFALQLQDELFLAAMQPEGFSRVINLPALINAKQYSLTFYAPEGNPHYFVISMDGHYGERQLPDLSLPTPDSYEVHGALIALHREEHLIISDHP